MSAELAKKSVYWAVMPAAGSGQRMQQALPKQYIEIGGNTIIEHSAGVLLDNDNIKQLVVCTAVDDPIWPSSALSNRSRVTNALGGDSRAQSVLNGLNALADATSNDWVLVHDAARPCLSAMFLDKLITALKNDPVGGILAMPAKDTLKVAQPESASTCSILKTTDRALIWQAQTPQMFRFGLLKDSLQQALENNVAITDEASALEWAGYHPKLVESDARILKVTTPEDVALAEFLLKSTEI